MTWSKKFKECQVCHTTDKKHLCKGICVTCYFRDYKKKSKEMEKKKENVVKIEMFRGNYNYAKD